MNTALRRGCGKIKAKYQRRDMLRHIEGDRGDHKPEVKITV